VAFLEIKADSDLNKVLLELQGKGQSIDKFLPTIGEMLVGAVNDVLEAEGPGWEPLADSTKAQRRGSVYKILQDTGVMAASLEPKIGPTYAEAVFGASYAIYHVTGTSRMPRRDPTDLGPFLDPLLDEVAQLLTQQLA
jgi:phage gpG-like protein